MKFDVAIKNEVEITLEFLRINAARILRIKNSFQSNRKVVFLLLTFSGKHTFDCFYNILLIKAVLLQKFSRRSTLTK